MITVNEEIYCNAKEAAAYLEVKRCTFYSNVRSQIKAYKVGTRRRLFYKQSELEPFRTIHIVNQMLPVVFEHSRS